MSSLLIQAKRDAASSKYGSPEPPRTRQGLGPITQVLEPHGQIKLEKAGNETHEKDVGPRLGNQTQGAHAISLHVQLQHLDTCGRTIMEQLPEEDLDL